MQRKNITAWSNRTGSTTPQTFDPSHSAIFVTFSSGNLVATSTVSDSNSPIFALKGVASGKYYWELVFTTSNTHPGGGLGNTGSSDIHGDWLGKYADTLGWYNDGSLWNNTTNVGTWATYTLPGTVRLCYALDVPNNKVWGRVGTTGNWNNSGTANPATNTGGLTIPADIVSNLATFPIVPAAMLYDLTGPDTVTGVFASASWAGAAPSGFGQM
jgi:hypothetical protein